jgi:hypothetical protein
MCGLKLERGLHITAWMFSSRSQEYYWGCVFVCVLILDKKCLFANEVLPSAVNIFVVNSFVAAECFIW